MQQVKALKKRYSTFVRHQNNRLEGGRPTLPPSSPRLRGVTRSARSRAGVGGARNGGGSRSGASRAGGGGSRGGHRPARGPVSSHVDDYMLYDVEGVSETRAVRMFGCVFMFHCCHGARLLTPVVSFKRGRDVSRVASVRVYHFWAMKRHVGGPLLRCFQSFPLLVNWARRDTAPKTVDPEMMKDPASRARVMEAYRRLIRIRQDLERARVIADLVRRREKLKREQVRAARRVLAIKETTPAAVRVCPPCCGCSHRGRAWRSFTGAVWCPVRAQVIPAGAVVPRYALLQAATDFAQQPFPPPPGSGGSNSPAHTIAMKLRLTQPPPSARSEAGSGSNDAGGAGASRTSTSRSKAQRAKEGSSSSSAWVPLTSRQLAMMAASGNRDSSHTPSRGVKDVAGGQSSNASSPPAARGSGRKPGHSRAAMSSQKSKSKVKSKLRSTPHRSPAQPTPVSRASLSTPGSATRRRSSRAASAAASMAIRRL